MQMTLTRALKHKNRVVERINRVSSDITDHNSILETNKHEVDIMALDRMRHELVGHLVVLKTLINRASDPMREKIFRMSELRGAIVFYRSIPTSHGTQEGHHRYLSDSPMAEYKAVIRKEDVDRIVVELETKIDQMQDSLDEFNSTTKINIEVPASVDRPYAPAKKD